MYYTIDDNNDHMFWVLILSIVCLCQGFQLCIVCKIGKTLLRKGKQVLIMKTCCGFNIYHNVHTSLRCKLYHVTINYENIILQHLNIYSVNVDNVFGDHMKVCFAIIIISRKETILEEQQMSMFFCFSPKCTNQTQQIGINIHVLVFRLTDLDSLWCNMLFDFFCFCFVEHYVCKEIAHDLSV